MLMNDPLKAMLLASCFPHPQNQLLGVWALSQAEALRQSAVDLKIISPTSYVPSILGDLGVAPWAAQCPVQARMGSFEIDYPRWWVYHSGIVRKITRRIPSIAMALGWRSLKRPILNAIKQHQPKVILAHHTFEGGELARRVKKSTGLPYVIVDWDFDEIADCRRFPFRYQHYRRVLANAHSVIATSERMKSDLAALFPTTRVKVAHYGRDPLPAVMLNKPRPSDRDGKIIIFSASGFFHRKGMPLLIQSFAKIQSRYPHAELWIAGDGPERDAAKQSIRAAGGQQIRLLGTLSHEDVLQEMIWSDFFALAGWNEPFATVYVEALAAGKPIICCNDGGICDVIQNEIHGLTVTPQDTDSLVRALDRLLGNQELRMRMSLAAQSLFQEKLTTSAYANVIKTELLMGVDGGGGAW